MISIGIICEYNPFHNGHVYHINKIKELYPDSRIILVMSGNFLQRGDASLINKWDKTRIALEYGVDLVVELPFVFASQGADKFAHGAISILDSLGVDKLVFGSEGNNISLLKDMANIQINNKDYDLLVKKYVNDGINYPTAMSMALKDLGGVMINNPNDILGLCYIKEIISMGSRIEPISIKRTNDYHSLELGSICSASAIREAIKNNVDISSFVPTLSLKYINKDYDIDKCFKFLKYKIITSNDLSCYVTVDDGIISRIKKSIYSCNSFDELINCVKTKRYTYNRIKRMFIHILCNFTDLENSKCLDIHYIRVLGFNFIGRDYLSSVKKSCSVPIISNFSGLKDIMLDIEFRSSSVYSLFFDYDLSLEFKSKPIIKQLAFSFILCYYYNGDCMNIKIYDDVQEVVPVNEAFNFKKLFIIILCVIVFIISVIVFCRYKATSGLKVIEYKITDSSLPDSFHGVKLVQFSDIYFGNTVDIKYFNNIVSSINELKPDIVVFTGDLLDRDIDDDTKNSIIGVLSSIDSSIGKYAISGDVDNDLFDNIISSSGFINLNNSSANLYYNGDTPIMIGSEDVSSDLFNILLIHEPDNVDDLNNSFNLILAGHSLGGQINLPFVRNLFLPNGAHKYYNGYYNVNGNPLYVSSGIGTTNFKYRFNNRPSVNLYRLTKY